MKTTTMASLIMVTTKLYIYRDAMPTICNESQRMKSRTAAFISSGEIAEEEAPSVVEGLVIAAMKGRVNWKTLLATECSCLLTRDRGIGSCESRCWVRFSAMAARGLRVQNGCL